MIRTDEPNPFLLDVLAEVVGIFGTRGWPECRVQEPGGKTTRVFGLPSDAAGRIKRARDALREFNRAPKPLPSNGK